MSKLSLSIIKCMSGLSYEENGSLSADFLFPEDFLGFSGHFPGKPVLPGICKIQAAVLMLREAKKTDFSLKGIVHAKFFSPVSCNGKVHFDIKEEDISNGELLVRVKVTGRDGKIADLHLKLSSS